MTTQQRKQIEHFFSEHVPAKEFAVCMRKFMYRAMLKYLSTEETECNDDFSNGYYWLTEFLETIDPQMK